MKRLVIFDIDGTVMRGQSQQLFVKFIAGRGIIGPVAVLKILGWFMLYKVGLAADPRSISEYAFAFLEGKDPRDIETLAEECVAAVIRKYFYKDAVSLIRHHKKDGDTVIFVSSAVEFIARAISRELTADDCLCTTLGREGGLYTGHILGKIMYGAEKLNQVSRYARENGYDLGGAIFYTDHDSDRELLGAVGEPRVVNPTSRLSRLARQNRWMTVNFK